MNIKSKTPNRETIVEVRLTQSDISRLASALHDFDQTQVQSPVPPWAAQMRHLVSGVLKAAKE